MTENICIYKITDLENGKVYIGQQRLDCWARRAHGWTGNTLATINGYLGSGTLIRKIIKEKGKENFKKEYLSFCETEEEANRQEKLYIEIYQSMLPEKGYNLMEGEKTNILVETSKGRKTDLVV